MRLLSGQNTPEYKVHEVLPNFQYDASYRYLFFDYTEYSIHFSRYNPINDCQGPPLAQKIVLTIMLLKCSHCRPATLIIKQNVRTN